MFGFKGRHLPRLIVFDLDYTIWPLWVDVHIDLPLRKTSSGVVDRHGRAMKMYPHAGEILQELMSKNIPVAAASRTEAIHTAEEAIKALDIGRFFKYTQIYPGSKVAHFKHFHKASGIPYREMLFFDDEQRNIIDISRLGVTAILVPDGLDKEIFVQGLKQYNETFAEEDLGTRK